MQENPFFHRGPIRDPAYFYNRKREVKLVLEMLGKGQSVSIIGSRKIGKTSLLFHISRPEVMRQHGLDPTHHLFIYINCEGLGNLGLEELYALVLKEVAGRATQLGYQLSSPEHPISHLELRQALYGVTGSNKGLRVALLLDEFEVLTTNRELCKRLFPGLRDLAQACGIAYLTVSQRPLMSMELDELHSPFFNIFLLLVIGLFDESESRELVGRSLVEGVAFLPEVLDSILELAGGHPFLLQAVCYWALELQAGKGVPLEGKDIPILTQVVRDQIEPHFEYYWNRLSDQERLVLIGLSIEEVALSIEQTPHVIRELESKALVAKQGSSYTPFSSAFAEFVRARAGRYSAEIGELYASLQEVQRTLDLRHREFARQAREFVERLCQRLGFDLLSQDSFPRSRLNLFTLDTKWVFHEIRLPNILPLLFIQGDKLVESDLDQIRQCLSEEMGTVHRVALLVFLGEGPAAARAKKLLFNLRQVYAYDVTLLTKDDLLRINVADDPTRELRKQILAYTDLLTVSPFIVTGPTTDEIFFGREHELREITESATLSSFAVIGGRRVGKSSLLGRLHRIRLPAAGFLTIYHDCSSTPTCEAFLTTAIHDWRPEPPRDVPTTLGDLLQSPPDGRPLVLLLDEADKLVPADRAHNWQLFNTLRGLANSGRVQVILSGERTLRETLQDPASPLFNFANEMLLGLLDYRAVEELVTRPMKQLEIDLVDETAIVDRVWAFTSGHPNVIQRLCRRLIERLNEQSTRRITLDDVDAVIEDPGFQRDDFLSTYWEAATPLEKVVSLLMADDENIRTLRAVRRTSAKRCNLRPKAREVDDALQRLVDLRSILERTPTGYKFAVEAFPRVVAGTLTLDDMLEILTEEYQEQSE